MIVSQTDIYAMTYILTNIWETLTVANDWRSSDCLKDRHICYDIHTYKYMGDSHGSKLLEV